MKIFITSALLCISFSAFSQAMLPYSIKYQDAPDNIWHDFDSTYITYTDGLKTQEYLYYYTFDSAWLFTQKNNFTYTPFDSLDVEMQYFSADGSFYDSVRFTHSYDDENYILQQLYFTWYTDAWHPEYSIGLTSNFAYDDLHRLIYRHYGCTRDEYFEYTDFDSLLHYTSYSYDAFCNLVPEYNNFYTYNAGHKKEYLQSQLYDFGSASWYDFAQVYYFYDADDFLDSTILKQISGVSWLNFLKNIYHYNDAGLLNDHIQQSATGTSWENSDEILYTYDGDGKLLERIELYWDAGAWQKSRRLYYNYDTLDRLLEYGYQVFVISEWTNYFRYLYYYDDAADTTVLALTDMNTDLVSYPNPFSDDVQFSLPQQNYTVKIYDIAGAVLFTGAFTGSSYTLHNANAFLRSGMYIAQFTNDRGLVLSTRLICEK